MKKQKMKLLSFSLAICLAGSTIYIPTYGSAPANSQGGVEEHIQSFEGRVPENWTASKGKLEVSSKHYKHAQSSLKWNWKNGDKLIVNNEENMAMASQTANGGMIAWVYNEKPIEDKITVNLGTKEQVESGNPQYTFDFHLNFEGWRALWIDFKDDAVNKAFEGERVGDIEQMEIIAPQNVESGNLYFDLVEFVNALFWSRTQDYQIPIERYVPGSGEWTREYDHINKKSNRPLEPITKAHIEAFNTIEKRFEDWVYGTGMYEEEAMGIRRESLDRYIASGLIEYENLNIRRDSEGSITGVPLFGLRSPYVKFGKRFAQDLAQSVFLPLVFDYKLNGNMDSLDKLMNLFDYYYDQGWAEGSGLGSLYMDTLRSSGYFVATYLMKDELEKTGRYEKQIGAVNWYSAFGKVNGEYKVDYTETTADEMRVHFLYRLLYVLAMEDSAEKVQAMQGYLEWVNSALEINPNFAGTIKPDYTGFHHRGIYIGAYAPNGYHLAALVNYLMHDTEFEISKQSKENLKGALIATDIMTNKYHVPQSLMGRLTGTDVTNKIVPAYAYMALAGDPATGESIDKEMAGIFMRLWRPESPYIQKLFPNCQAGLGYMDTLGGLELMLGLEVSGIEATEAKQGFFTKPYGGLTINKAKDWTIANKGWSQYVWDYENGGSSKENAFGRYISYGSIQIMVNEDPVKDGYDMANGWDWNRIPGATTKHLPLELLCSTANNNTHRNFTDQTFLGGVSSEGQNGIFSLMLHDTQYDKSFYANKTNFYFGDEIICLGSGIQNNDKDHSTETTLFQTNLNNNKEMPFYLNSTEPITQYPYEKEFKVAEKVWMVDPYGNGYYIPEAEGIHIKRDTQISRDRLDKVDTQGEYTTAWIDHGKAPQGGTYEYVIKVQTTPEEMQDYAKEQDYEVLQQDNNAHILKHNKYNTTAYAIFNASQEIEHGMLSATDTPIMAMLKEKNEQEILLSLSDPDLRLPKVPSMEMDKETATTNSMMKTTTITLKGNWKLEEERSDVRIVANSNGQTVIEFDCIDGETKEVALIK